MSSQGYTIRISLFTILLFFIFIQIVLATNTITYFVNSTTTTEYTSSLATLNSVVYNTTINATQLSGTTLTGNITSQVYDLGSQAQFGNITWAEGAPYGIALLMEAAIQHFALTA